MPANDSPVDMYDWFFAATPSSVEGGFDDYVGVVDHTTAQTTRDFLFDAGIAADQGGPLTVSPVGSAAPEPAPILLMLFGAGLIFLMRIPRTE
ncbi:MAG TPA: PEP-CTERM sorting domain-containing protein [Candidatus Acidoferrales bacterium]|nr:PEP-CTERM sorting domain-containing protein [Candidatus Acidoferrales bacterium]